MLAQGEARAQSVLGSALDFYFVERLEVADTIYSVRFHLPDKEV
jgi:hypothetical protein